MAEGKGPPVRETAEISRLITGHAVNNTPEASRSTLHAYEVALKTTRDKCQKQAEQLRTRDEETRRLLADKTALHAEIESLRQSTGRQRDKASQLHREMAARHRECQTLREQTATLTRQLSTARRRLEAAGLMAADLEPPSIEQANRGTDEVHVQVPVAPEEGAGSPPSEDPATLSEEEIARRLLELQTASRRSLQDSFQDVLSGMRRVAAADAAAVAGGEMRPDLRQVAEVLRQRNDALRQNVTQLLRLRERGAVPPPLGEGSLPPLHDIPLTSSPPPAAEPSPVAPSAAERVCPLCAAVFRPHISQNEFEDHVYAHVVDMVVEDGPPPPPAGTGSRPLETVISGS